MSPEYEMKILIVGDKESQYIWEHYDYDRFSGLDFIISTGDLKPEFLSFLVTITNVPLFYVHGNHDTLYKTIPPEGCDSIDGKFIKYKGLRIMGLGGSQFYNSRNHQYTESEMSRRLLKLKPYILFNKGVDIFVSHAPAFGLGDGKDLCHTGFKCFTKLIETYQPAYHFHGHQHLNYGDTERSITKNNTKIINSYEYQLLEF